LLLASLLAGACTTFGSASDAPPTGADAGPPADGGDADVVGASPDAGQDGAADSPPASESPCLGDAAAHLLCDDFDEDTTLSRWSVSVGAGATLDAAPAPMPPSPPNVLFAVAPSDQFARIGKGIGLPASAAGVACSFSVRIDARPGCEAVLLTFDLVGGAAYYRVETHLLPTGAPTDDVIEYGTYPDGGALAPVHHGPPLLKAGVWHHIAVALAFGARPGLTTSIDGTELIGKPANDLSTMPAATFFTISVGATAFSGTGAWSVQLDDVVCDATP
jgi:hypothetical protein